MYEGIDTVVLDEELAYQDVAPLLWRPLTAIPTSEEKLQIADRNLRLLQAFVALEESSQADKSEPNTPYAADILRLDMKVNLLLDLVGRILVANQPRPAPVQLRFNALSAAWKCNGQLPQLGDEGVVEIYLKDCLLEPLRLAGRVGNVSDEGIVKIKFHNLGAAIADLIEKIVFRRHRRQVAGSRQPRASDALRIAPMKK